MSGDAAEDERRQEGQRHDEGVEEAVVALPHAVSHPGAVMVEALWKREPEEPPERGAVCRRAARVRARVHGSPTQLSHRLQWEVRGGRNILQVKQYLSFTSCWLMTTSWVRGGGR